VKNLGVNINCSGNLEDIKLRLENLIKAEYRVVYFDGDFLDPSIEKEKLKEIVKIIRDTSLEPFSAHNLQVFPENPEKPEDIIPFQKEIFEKAKILGVKHLTCHFGWSKGLNAGEDFDFDKFLRRKQITIEDYREKNIEIFKKLCEIAKDYDLKLTIENLPPKCLADMTTKIEDILVIIQQIQEDNVGICLDSGHGFIASMDFYRSISKAGNKLFETHFHDNLGKISNSNFINDLHQPCGIGTINWVDIISGLKKINFRNPVVFEIGCDLNCIITNKRNWAHFYSLYKERFSRWPEVEGM